MLVCSTEMSNTDTQSQHVLVNRETWKKMYWIWGEKKADQKSYNKGESECQVYKNVVWDFSFSI